MKVSKLQKDFYISLGIILTFGISMIIYFINFALLDKYGDNPAYRDVPTILSFFYTFFAFIVNIFLIGASLINGLVSSQISTKKKIGIAIIICDALLGLANILIPLSSLLYIIVNP